MNMLDAILGAQNGGAVRQIGSQLGLPEDRTAAALSALVPALAAGLQRNTESAGGLESLLSALSGGSHSQYLDNPATLSQPNAIADGNGILSHVFGSKDVSRAVADRASAQTGVGADVLKRMLPMAATLAMGALARQTLTTGAAPASGLAGGGLMNMLSATVNQSQGGSMLDELTGLVGRLLQK